LAAGRLIRARFQQLVLVCRPVRRWLGRRKKILAHLSGALQSHPAQERLGIRRRWWWRRRRRGRRDGNGCGRVGDLLQLRALLLIARRSHPQGLRLGFDRVIVAHAALRCGLSFLRELDIDGATFRRDRAMRQVTKL
ncbi:MAG: hypothetical protein M3Y86_05500, partial [Verrucomicrobiota bacterium]|nr:hypothetical protein [Verrucomicrobiota bacterium]